jgi:hypothetical protein
MLLTHSASLKEDCIGKLDCSDDRKRCGKLSLHETLDTHVTQTYLSAYWRELKTDRLSNKLLHTEPAAVIHVNTILR